MKLERKKNASRNIVFGIILKIYQIGVPFLMRTAMIFILGVEYLGLNSLFTSVLQVLNLAELGVGSAMVFSMYKPIAEDDNKAICALMRLYKVYYRVIGIIVLVIGLILLPFLPNLISGDILDEINIYILYLLNLGATVLSYWLFAYKNSLLIAHQRTDITSKVGFLTNTIQYGLQFLMLWIFRNYYYYLIVALFTQVINNIVTAIAANKLYPQYEAEGMLDKHVVRGINQRIKDLFTAKLGSTVVNSTDSIVISAFLGLTTLSIYNNYYYILTAVIGLILIVFNSCTAGIGNSIITESIDKNYNDLYKFTFIIGWVVGFCTCCLLSLYQHFIKLWMGEKLMFDFGVVICFCVYFFILEMNQLLSTYKDAAGIWHEDRFRPLITALVNLILNIILVNVIGIYGVLLSTIISMVLVGMPWMIHNIFSILFNRSPWHYICKLLKYSTITGIGAIATYEVCLLFPAEGLGWFMAKMLVCCIIPNAVFLLCYHRSDEFDQAKDLVLGMIKRKK